MFSLGYEPSPEDLRYLRNWINKVPYLPHDLDDHVLATLYRTSKGSLEHTKHLIDRLFEGLVKYPEITSNMNPLDPAIQKEYNEISRIISLTEKKTPGGSTIIIGQLLDSTKHVYNPYNTLKAMSIIFLNLILENEIQEGKVMAILDFKNLKLWHTTGISTMFMFRLVSYVMYSFPFRIEAIHVVNTPQIAEWAVTLTRSALSKKISERVFVHRTSKDLIDLYPKEILPSDFGGDLESMAVLFEKHRKRLEKQASKFVETEMKWRKCEALRTKTGSSDMIVGSFRNLQID